MNVFLLRERGRGSSDAAKGAVDGRPVLRFFYRRGLTLLRPSATQRPRGGGRGFKPRWQGSREETETDQLQVWRLPSYS